MPKAKNVMGTIISFRVSVENKQRLLEIAKTVEAQAGAPATVTDIIKEAIKQTYGLDLFEDSNG